MLPKYAMLLLVLSLSLSSSIALTVVSLLYVRGIQMIDYSAVEYGFPYPCLTHIGVTIAGRTDIWRFEPSNLVKDVTLFFLLSFGLWSIILLSMQRTRLPKSVAP
jgi:hypothetical protein